MLVALLNARAALALKIGRLKQTLEMAIYQPAREEAVLRHVRERQPRARSTPTPIARLFERIIDEARRLERADVQDETKARASSRAGQPSVE